MKKINTFAAFAAAVFMLAVLSLGSISCSQKPVIGVLMPKLDVDRWLIDGSSIKRQLEAKQYSVTVEYANDDAALQIAQIEKIISGKNCKALIIAGVDCYGLNDVLKKAHDKKILIIAYDRLIMNTPYVDYYVTFDNFGIGADQGQYIVEEFGLDKQEAKPVYMEILSGAFDDSTSKENYDGQMSVIKPYIDNGKIIVKSGETTLEATAIPDWATKNAETHVADILDTYYGNTKINTILSTNDSMAMGAMDALRGAGYTKDDWPLITGMDCDLDNVRAIRDGWQAISMFIDMRLLASVAVYLAEDALSGKIYPNLNKSYYNNM
ncbi:MAG: sugar-binding protein, partial [Treponema sp.]|nr:sugar-binding protein [Treponema sp.]